MAPLGAVETKGNIIGGLAASRYVASGEGVQNE